MPGLINPQQTHPQQTHPQPGPAGNIPAPPPYEGISDNSFPRIPPKHQETWNFHNVRLTVGSEAFNQVFGLAPSPSARPFLVSIAIDGTITRTTGQNITTEATSSMCRLMSSFITPSSTQDHNTGNSTQNENRTQREEPSGMQTTETEDGQTGNLVAARAAGN